MRIINDNFLSHQVGSGFYVYAKQFFRDGMLFKNYPITDLQRDILPTVEEKAMFAEKKTLNPEDIFNLNSSEQTTGESNENNLMMDTEKEEEKGKSCLFFKGDKVRVIAGELKGLEGVVRGSDTIRNDVQIIVTMGDNTEVLDLKGDEIMKQFTPGTHVKVMLGPFSGETGVVVICDDESNGRAVVISDFGDKEMHVFVNHLVESVEVSTGMKSVGGFELGDLISVGNNEFTN